MMHHFNREHHQNHRPFGVISVGRFFYFLFFTMCIASGGMVDS